MYYIGIVIIICEVFIEWEYLLFVGFCLFKGFVGLKNVGVICYMNFVI